MFEPGMPIQSSQRSYEQIVFTSTSDTFTLNETKIAWSTDSNTFIDNQVIGWEISADSGITGVIEIKIEALEAYESASLLIFDGDTDKWGSTQFDVNTDNLIGQLQTDWYGGVMNMINAETTDYGMKQGESFELPYSLFSTGTKLMVDLIWSATNHFIIPFFVFVFFFSPAL